jgi:hypothetical protein
MYVCGVVDLDVGLCSIHYLLFLSMPNVILSEKTLFEVFNGSYAFVRVALFPGYTCLWSFLPAFPKIKLFCQLNAYYPGSSSVKLSNRRFPQQKMLLKNAVPLWFCWCSLLSILVFCHVFEEMELYGLSIWFLCSFICLSDLYWYNCAGSLADMICTNII